jgi:chemotaxis protein CheD
MRRSLSLMEKQSDEKVEIKKETIIQEQMSIGIEETQILTVLGSSVAVTLYDTQKKIGGMVHFLQPVWDGIGFKTLRYGNIATQRLINALLEKGSQKEHLQAKIIGGADMNPDETNRKISIGLRNVGIAKEILEENGIEIVAEDIGKELGRFVVFNSSSGKVDIRYSSKK